ncbi:MAG: DUF748 domain-containing protein [Hydrogenophilaceae bacterium]|nr:DUF748 domain-containing protein [Hydrogenophilaceae bacterium]
MLARLTKILLSLPFLVAAGVFGFYLVFGFFLVDPVAKKLLPWVGEKKLASQLSAQKVEFNPLTLEATIQGLKLAEKSGKPLAGFDRLYVNLDTTGLFRFAWRIRDIQLSGPRANFVVQPGGKLNWQALIDKLNEDKEPPKDTMPRVLIDHIKIEKGDIDYTDANRAGEPFRVSLTPLGIELDGLSTLPEDRGNYLIAAKLPEQGGTLKWKGDVSLNPVKSDGEVALEGVNLPNLRRVIKTQRNFELPSGTLAAGMRYRFALVKDKSGPDKSGKPRPDRPWMQVNGANLVLQNLALAPRSGGERVFELAEAKIENANLDLFKRSVSVAAVSLSGGKLAATREVDGRLDWQTLFAVAGDAPPSPAKTEAASKSPASSAPPWKIAVNSINLGDWSARYTDKGFAAPLRVEASGFELNARLEGEVGDKPLIVIGPVNAVLGPVSVFSGADNVAQLDQTRLLNAKLALADKRLSIDAIELSGAKTSVKLDKDKRINWNAILAKHPDAPVAQPASHATGAAGPGLDLNLGKLGIDGVEVAVTDESAPTPVKLDIVSGRALVRDITLDLNKPLPVEVGLAIRQGGTFKAIGSVIPGKASGKLDLKLANLSFKPFAPYVNKVARLKLQSGTLSSSGKLDFAKGKETMKLDYDGGFAVDTLAITEEDTNEAFLGWEKLSSNSLEFNLGPNSLHMRELVAVRPFGKVIIFEDKSINLKRILRSSESPKPEQASSVSKAVEEPEADATPPAPAPSPAVPAASDKPSFPLVIERLRIEEANAEFVDLSLTPQFGTRMHALSGVVTGLSADPATFAQVELDGKVDEFGSARVRGSIQPFKATDFTDLRLSFRNLEMTSLTPYSGKFAGRKIDSGKLSVDLEYKIKNRQLAGENKFVINKLKLGERVDSKDAMKLPLDLAIALLEDSNGVIDLDLPISGSLDDPKFSYGKIIWKAIVNVLTKLVTAPFRALGKLLGVSSEKLEAVTFDPGSSKLMPPEQEKLKMLAEALSKRPALTLTLEPGFDPVVDRRALQEMEIRRQAADVAGIRVAPNEAPGPVDVNLYKMQTWLEDRYKAAAGKQDYQKLRESFRDRNAGAAARVMESEAVERLARRFKTRDPGPPSAFHAELLERLTQKTVVDDSELNKLAQSRSQAMREELVKRGLDAARVNAGDPVKQEAKDRQVGSKMSLGVGKKSSTEPEKAVPAMP